MNGKEIIDRLEEQRTLFLTQQLDLREKEYMERVMSLPDSKKKKKMLRRLRWKKGLSPWHFRGLLHPDS